MAHENEAVEEAVRWFETVRAERTLPLSFLGFGGADDFYGGILAREITKLRASAPKVWDAGSEYDKAVEALAPYLPDGWVAQDADDAVYWYSKRPILDGYEWKRIDTVPRDLAGTSKTVVNSFGHDHYPDSLRRIQGGKVVPQPPAGGGA